MKKFRLLSLLLLCIFTLSTNQGWCQDNSDYSFQRGLEEYNSNNYSEALEWFQTAVKQDPNNFLANMYISSIMGDDKKFGAALSAINKAIQSIPKKDKEMLSFALSLRGDIYVTMGDTIKGLQDYENSIKSDPSNRDVYKARGQVYYEQGKYSLADSDYNKMIDLDPTDTMGYMGQARNKIAQSQWDDAIQLLDYVIKLSPDYSSAYSFRAEANLGLGNTSVAVDDIIQAISINGDNKAHIMLLSLKGELYPIVKAKLQLQANKDSNKSPWLYYLGILSEMNDKYKDAIGYYLKAYDLQPNYIFLKRLADSHYAIGNYNMALSYVNKALDIAEDKDGDLLMIKGNILNEMGNQDDAIQSLDLYIDRNPEYGYAYYRRGWFKDEKDDREGAIDDYTLAIMLDPTYAYSYIGRGRDYDMLGHRELAIKDYNKVIELDTVPSDNSCAQYAYLFLGEKEKAIKFMDKYMQNSTGLTGGTYDAACLYSLMDEPGKALLYLEQALQRGYRRFAHIEVDRDLENIRNLPEFKSMIEKYKKIQEEVDNSIGQSSSSDLSFSKVEEIIEIPYTKELGVTKIKCTVNDLPLYFVFDTGAADVTLSSVEANFMLKNNYIKPSDFIGSAKYIDANGDINEGAVLNIREVNIGGLNLKNVRATVIRNQKAPLLLGQSVLSRLGKIEIDNSHQKIIISNSESH